MQRDEAPPSVVMPMCDAREHLERTLRPLAELASSGRIELIVVDDGSLDGGDELARELGATVVPSGGRRRGPAHARNVGVAAARGPVVVFVDADVVVHEGSVEAFHRALTGHDGEGPAAVYGSYDDAPPAPGFFSRYMNLRHHFYHRTPTEDSPSFWSGLGAVHRESFLAVGGFDASRFACPSIEDIDLGHRLRRAGGRIRRDPAIRGTHLKRWSLLGSVRTDVLRRAWPWARLMARRPGEFGELNVSRAERGRAALAGLLAAAVGAASLGFVPLWVPFAAAGAAVVSSRELLALFTRRGGPLFGVAGVLWHQVYYLYSSAVYVAATLVTRPDRATSRPDSEAASAGAPGPR